MTSKLTRRLSTVCLAPPPLTKSHTHTASASPSQKLSTSTRTPPSSRVRTCISNSRSARIRPDKSSHASQKSSRLKEKPPNFFPQSIPTPNAFIPTIAMRRRPPIVRTSAPARKYSKNKTLSLIQQMLAHNRRSRLRRVYL